VSEGQQGFEGREGAGAAGGSKIAQGISELLEIGQGDLTEGLPYPGSAFDVGPIGPLGVDRSAVEPDFEEMIVGGG
jgi:hypothetical protein